MVYLIIGVALLLIIVPILTVLPSARQKAQMKMRNVARQAGISVELTSIDDPDPDPEKYLSGTGKPLPRVMKVIAYRRQRRRMSDWRLLPEISFCYERVNNVLTLSEPLPELMSTEMREWLPVHVSDLPDDVKRVEEKGFNLTVYWHEREPGDEQLVIDFLNKCAEVPLYNETENED